MTHGVQIRRSIGDGSQGGSEGLDTCDYLVYPVGAVLTDKPRTQTGIPKHLCDIGAASELAARLFDCALDRHYDGLRGATQTWTGNRCRLIEAGGQLHRALAQPRLPYR